MAKIKNIGKGIVLILKKSFRGIGEHNLTKLSGSLAYSTVFSMAPLLIVIIWLCSIFLGRDAVEGKIYGQLTAFIGSDAALQLQQIIKNASINGKSNFAIIGGIITLLLGSTAIFGEIQDSINIIWEVKAKPKRGWVKILKNRFLSFSVLIGLGFLLLVSLSVGTVIDVFSSRLQQRFPEVTVVIFYLLNIVVTLAVTTAVFAVIFKVLPDAVIRWKDIFIGALATTIFFMLGKFTISFYISRSSIGSTYGTAGSLVVLLLWVYYSSIILYFGAEITKTYAVEFGNEIHPKAYAVTTKTVEIETGKNSLQEKEKIRVKPELKGPPKNQK